MLRGIRSVSHIEHPAESESLHRRFRTGWCKLVKIRSAFLLVSVVFAVRSGTTFLFDCKTRSWRVDVLSQCCIGGDVTEFAVFYCVCVPWALPGKGTRGRMTGDAVCLDACRHLTRIAESLLLKTLAPFVVAQIVHK